MNRYNQGFGGFGPLEQCKDGRLVFAKDHDQEVNSLKKEISVLKTENFELKEEVYWLEVMDSDEKKIRRELNKKLHHAKLRKDIAGCALAWLFATLAYCILLLSYGH